MKLTAHTILECLIALIGVSYAVVLLIKGLKKDREKENGSFAVQAAVETAVFFLAAMGFSDFLLNIPIFSRTGWVREDRIPPSLIATTVVPGTVIALFYLRTGEAADLRTLLPCMAAILAGSWLGSKFLLKTDGALIRKIMLAALVFSMAALCIRLIVSRGAAGVDTALNAGKLLIAVPIVFVLGFINPFGVPMKPAATALFLILGLSPVAALSVVLGMGAVAPTASCVNIVRSGQYHKKLSLAGLSFGTLGAVLGCLLAVSLDQLLLTVILLIIIAFTIVSLQRKLRKTENKA